MQNSYLGSYNFSFKQRPDVNRAESLGFFGIGEKQEEECDVKGGSVREKMMKMKGMNMRKRRRGGESGREESKEAKRMSSWKRKNSI